jgi:uncharacterized protein (DUF2164 family)
VLGELTPERRRRLARDLQQYLRDHLDTDPGELGSELLLQRAADLVGPVYYKRAIDDARAELKKAAAALDRELADLEKDPQGR